MSTPRNAPDLQAAIAVTRFGVGARPGEMELVQHDPRGWLLSQIRREGADQPDGSLLDSRASLADFRQLRADVRDLKQEAAVVQVNASPGAASGSEAAAETIRAKRRMDYQPLREQIATEMLARTRLGATTPAGFRERWTLFWANHFTVSAAKLRSAVLAGPFEREAIRPHVFGRFEDLLVASSTHPGMLVYLDQATSIGPDSLAGERRQAGLNENLGREILELHTVGAEAGYTQADVTEFARALTGYSIGGLDAPDAEQGVFFYRARYHEPGVRTVLGRRYDQQGPDQAGAVLHDLAGNPKTATRLSRKLAAHFVSDDPSPALVARLTEAWTNHNGDLAVVARTLVESPEAWEPAARKFKTPNDFIVSAYRAAGAAPEAAVEVVAPLTALGQRPFSAPQPNGWSEDAVDWATGAALMRRLTWSQAFGESHAPAAAPLQVADASLGPLAGPALRAALSRAETRPEAFSYLLMSPEFQRR